MFNIKEVDRIVDVASSGQAAIDMIKEAYTQRNHSYGLILMDLSMPFMNGYEATYLIRNYIKSHCNNLQPAIVACSGHNESEYIQKAFRYQMDELIYKPVSLEMMKIQLSDIVDDRENN